MTDDRKKELFPYFAFLKAKELNPERYKNATIENFGELIKDNQEDIDAISKMAIEADDSEWESIEKAISEVQLAKKGAKLVQLQKYKKGKKAVKKCGCGCDMIDVKEEGGKISSHCSCKCGGKIKKESKIDSKKLNYLKKIKK